MFPASLTLIPVAPVLPERSAPARSTMEILREKKEEDIEVGWCVLRVYSTYTRETPVTYLFTMACCGRSMSTTLMSLMV